MQGSSSPNGYDLTTQQNLPLMLTDQQSLSEEPTPVQPVVLNSFFDESLFVPGPGLQLASTIFQDSTFTSSSLGDQFAMITACNFGIPRADPMHAPSLSEHISEPYAEKNAAIPILSEIITVRTVKEYLGELYDPAMSAYDDVKMVMEKNGGYFPSIKGKLLVLESLEFTCPDNATWYLPWEVRLENCIFVGQGTLHLTNGSVTAKASGSNLVVETSDAVGYAKVDGATVTASNGATAGAGSGGKATALDNRSKLGITCGDDQSKTQLKAIQAGTMVTDFRNGYCFITDRVNQEIDPQALFKESNQPPASPSSIPALSQPQYEYVQDEFLAIALAQGLVNPSEAVSSPSDSSQTAPLPLNDLSNDFYDYFGTNDSYDKSKSVHDNVVAIIIKNDGKFPSIKEKELYLSQINFQFSDASNLVIHLPKEVCADYCSFSGVAEVHVENGTVDTKEAGIKLFVTSSTAVGRALISGTTVIASTGAKAIAGNGGTAIATDKESMVARAPDDDHADTRLEARETGTTVIEYVGYNKFSYETIKDNYVCIGNKSVEAGSYENK